MANARPFGNAVLCPTRGSRGLLQFGVFLENHFKRSHDSAGSPSHLLGLQRPWLASAGTDSNHFQISTTGVNDGDLLLMVVCGDDAATPIPNPMAPGFTQLSQDQFGNDGQFCAAGYKIASSEPASYSVTLNGTNFGQLVVSLLAVSGVNTADPIDASAVTIQTGTSPQPPTGVSNGLTTSVPNTLLVYASDPDWDSSPGAITFTQPTGYSVLSFLGDNGNSSANWVSIGTATKSKAVSGATGAISGTQSAGSASGLSWTLLVAVAPSGTAYPQPSQLAITSAPQTVGSTWSCSGALTVQAQNGSGQPVNARTGGFNFNLSGNFAFFSDSSCIQRITSGTIPAGSTSTTIYFEGALTGSQLLTASASGVTSATQTETISALAAYTWIGGASCDGVWSTAACWQGGAVPGSSNIAHFDANCTTHCAASLTADATAGGVMVHPTSVGSLSLAGHILTSNDDVRFDGGTVDLNGTLIVRSNFNVTTTSISTTGSTIQFDSQGDGEYSLQPGTIGYNNVSMMESVGIVERTFYPANSAMTINGTLTLANTTPWWDNIQDGTLDARGNVVITNSGLASGGGQPTGVVRIAGSSNQLVDASGTTTGYLQALTIASTGGTVTFKGAPIIQGDYRYVSGMVDFTTQNATLQFDHRGDVDAVISPGTVAYNNVSFLESAGITYRTLDTGSTMTVNGTLKLGTTTPWWFSLDGGTIDAKGNVVLTGRGVKGLDPSTVIRIAGSSNQLVDASATTTGYFPSLSIASTGGTVTFKGTPIVQQNYAYVSGTVDFTTQNATLAFDHAGDGELTIDPGSITYNHVSIPESAGIVTRTLASGSTMNVGGNLSIGGITPWGITISGGTFKVTGNVTMQSAAGVNTDSNYTVTGNWSTTSSTFTATAGTTTFTAGADHTIAGTSTFYNLTMDNSGVTTANALNFPKGLTQTINGTLYLKGNTTNHLSILGVGGGSASRIAMPAVQTMGGYLTVQDSRPSGFDLHTGANSTLVSGTGTTSPKWISP